MIDELLQQWQKDVDDYGDNAYLMFKYQAFINESYRNFKNNSEVSSNISSDYVKRKQSAELPFDFERAKSGDEVEFYADELGFYDITVKFIGESATCGGMITVQDKYGYHDVEIENLCMKYPQKVKK